MGKKTSIIYQAIQRLDGLMAIGQSRHQVKTEHRAVGDTQWSISDGKIHSHVTRRTYQQQSLQFVNWVRDTYGIRDLAQIDARRGELVRLYLTGLRDAGRSAWTLKTARSALRTFLLDRNVGQEVQLPVRHREDIKRSRQPATRDQEINLDHWRDLVTFLEASGLRLSEVRDLRVEDISGAGDRVIVRNGKGGKWREVEVRQSYQAEVRRIVGSRVGHEHVFPRIPSHLDIHAIRRTYAQGLYMEVSGQPLPPSEGRLRPGAYDPIAVARVSRNLGHARLDVVRTNYLR
jgi:integrase